MPKIKRIWLFVLRVKMFFKMVNRYFLAIFELFEHRIKIYSILHNHMTCNKESHWLKPS